ncbi:hypothetical protein [Breznakia pachnodae]|uniref:Cytochrome bd-type quinol oxidase subunit 2 n=1 Tax=Breznakia pachnodae TaxID=265178 RepID=A0ABU0E8L7_9FIRM|nr:hypothetical protein [Breznakia pachnodae]MDQ0363242.1 cytochrome bd-type quinol oxidase subunit 2 [Breznakia pachnodae]
MKIKTLWKQTKTKLFLSTATVTGILVMNNTVISAEDAPTFDNSAAEEVASGWVDPATTFALWAVPILTLLVLVVHGLTWMSKDEEDKESKPYQKTAKRIIFVAIGIESIGVILKIVGIK